MSDNPDRHIEYIPLDDIKGAPRNYRQHDIGAIVSSLKRNQYVSPMVVDERTGCLLIGHGRRDALLAMKKAGEKAPQGVQVDGDVWRVAVLRGVKTRNDHDAEAILVSDNRVAQLASNDDAVLAGILKDLASAPDGLLGTGYDGDDLDDILKDLGQQDERDADAVPEPPKTPATKMGDVWEMGEHRLLCGNSAEGGIATVMGSDKANLCFTDPPYGVSYIEKTNSIRKASGKMKDRTGEAIAGDDLPMDELEPIVRAAFKGVADALTPDGSYYVCSPQGGGLGLMMMMMMMRDSGIPCRHGLVWAKNCPVFSMGRLDYSYQHEPICYGWMKSHKFQGPNTETSLWQIDKPSASKLHPTMKPVALVERAIRNSSLPGDIVLDPFGGSGTTLIASEKTGRRCRMVELSPAYCDIIVQRYEDYSGGKAKRI